MKTESKAELQDLQLPNPLKALSDPSETSQVQVDGEAAESFIAEKRIGERIKYLATEEVDGAG